ncbi:MAG: hypothetical protein Q8K98_13320 [Bacteroidota bacterium]|nr:hypothetical protein [Bacteroidota bacterium]
MMIKPYVYTYRKVTRRGKKDGRNWKWKFWPFKEAKPMEPKTDQQMPAQFETEIIQGCENDGAHIANEWKELDKKLKPEYCKVLKYLRQRKEKYDKEAGEENEVSKEYETARNKYQELPAPALNPSWHLFWMIIIGIVEFPLNGLVFSLFGADRIETYIMASAMCFAVPLLAHFFGKSLRQEIKSTTDIALLIAMPIVMLATLGVVAFLRAKFFEAIQSYELLGISLSPQQATILFVIINVAIFFIAVIISYEGNHPNHAEYKNVLKRYKEALKRLKKESGEAKMAGEELKQAELKYQQLRQHREKSHQRYLQEIHIRKELGEWLVAAYRASNLKVRGDIPECFKKEPIPLTIPDSMVNLDWDCHDFREGNIAGEKV